MPLAIPTPSFPLYGDFYAAELKTSAIHSAILSDTRLKWTLICWRILEAKRLCLHEDHVFTSLGAFS